MTKRDLRSSIQLWRIELFKILLELSSPDVSREAIGVHIDNIRTELYDTICLLDKEIKD